MKKVFLLIALFGMVMLSSCTDNTEENLPNETETQELQQVLSSIQTEEIAKLIDPEKECPPNDRNCNGVPDDQE
ncbi:hypothetical protein [Tenacibaculum caenipelagi]|uniref:Secreted protein n=1 Tax=Tenacibaculum caenipelagi TaxID=1325435 RepID=A0A4R6TG74_9FLAO|nr:hypothetical protein [Tenacibaculum caenipelagi]TDQ27689.1 hypothetical protein DFQ07_1540 [Tenacibaculum caenipelagi]